MRRDLREGGVIASLVVQNENIPNLILIESKPKIPRVWGNLREDLGNLRDKIDQDLIKHAQNQFFLQNQHLGFVLYGGLSLL